MAELLLTSGANVNARTRNGNTPLHSAAFYGHMEIAELLLARGADVNAKTQNGTTPMHWAAIKDHKDVVEMLLQHGGINLGGVRPSDTWW